MWKIEYGVVLQRGKITPDGTDMTSDRAWPDIERVRVMLIGPANDPDHADRLWAVHLNTTKVSNAGEVSSFLLQGYWEPADGE